VYLIPQTIGQYAARAVYAYERRTTKHSNLELVQLARR
jgi:hypothetical protein